MKTVVLCRHAKSSWKDPELSDFERPLNKRGKKDGPVMARRLANQLKVEHILASPARRAQVTAEFMAKELQIPSEQILYDQALYASSPYVLLQRIQTTDDRYCSMMLVGHNPELTMLANTLGSLRLVNIPTCGMICLTFSVARWQDISQGKGALVFFDYPKNPQFMT